MTEAKPTHDQIRLVKQTWAIFRNLKPHVIGDVFYGKLFLDNPDLNRLFEKYLSSEKYGDINMKLIEVLGMIVSRLDRPEELRLTIQVLASDGEKAGIPANYYTKATGTLLWTLRQGLGNDWNLQTENAWVTCIGSVYILWRSF